MGRQVYTTLTVTDIPTDGVRDELWSLIESEDALEEFLYVEQTFSGLETSGDGRIYPEDYVDEVVELSADYPGVLFTLQYEDTEESPQLGRCYIRSGVYQHARAEILYPECEV